MTPLYNICLNPAQQMMHGSEFEYILQRYFYPIVALFGIFGNFLNLTVLLNRSMRSRANTFLSMLAFADIIFLLLLFPNVFANYPPFTFNTTFRWIYFHTKVHLISLANWCSSIAIWCVILVCTDRLIGIRNPLYVRGGWGPGRMPVLLCSVILITGIVTFYQHFEYECLVRWYCEDKQVHSRCMPINNDGGWFGNKTNPYSTEYRTFLHISTIINVFSMIILPIVLLTILNMMLLCILRQRQKRFSMSASGGGKDSQKRDSSAFQKTEHRVTLTVTCIVTMFTLTNGPSAVWHLLKTAFQWDTLYPKASYNVTMMCSTLVICGKASNFIVFCLGSKHFRLRLMKLAQKKVHKKMVTTTTEKSYIRSCSIGRRVLLVTSEKRQKVITPPMDTVPMRRASSIPQLDLIRLVEDDNDDCDMLSSNLETLRSRRLSNPSITSPRQSISIEKAKSSKYSIGSLDQPLLPRINTGRSNSCSRVTNIALV